MNTVSDANTTQDSHIAGSHALFVFILTISLLWVIVLSFLTFCLTTSIIRKKRRRIDPYKTETVKYRNLKKRDKTFRRVWSFINFAILWLDLVVIIYCNSGSRNCVLHHLSIGLSIGGEGLLVFCAIITYLIQLYENELHRKKLKILKIRSRDTLQEDLLCLIHWEKPNIYWEATCSHSNGEDEIVVTHTEVISCSTKIS